VSAAATALLTGVGLVMIAVAGRDIFDSLFNPCHVCHSVRISAATSSTVRRTAGERPRPASKLAPSMPTTSSRSGRRPSDRPSSTASATLRWWVEAEKTGAWQRPVARVEAVDGPGRRA
jgi:hypothetical protein